MDSRVGGPSQFHSEADGQVSSTHSEWQAARWITLSKWIASAAVLLVGTRYFVGAGVTIGNVTAVALTPVWAHSLRRYVGARPLMVLGISTAILAILPALHSKTDHVFSPSGLIDTLAYFLGALAAIGVLLWARELLPLWLVGTLFALGMLFTALLAGEASNLNPWKFGLGFPIMAMVLAFVSRPNWRKWELIALVAFCVAALGTDSRYRLAALAISLLVVVWQALPAFRNRHWSTVATLAVIAGVGLATYSLATTLLIDGYLGEQAQDRTIAQIDQSGSLLLGGRPELGATTALMLDQPFGFGIGISPTYRDILVAKEGMAAIGYAPNNGYVEVYLFGSGFELHSVTGDLWAQFGIPGVVFVGYLAFLMIRRLGQDVGHRSAYSIIVFLVISSLWNLAFSPIYGSLPTLVLTIGLCLRPSEPSTNATQPTTGL